MQSRLAAVLLLVALSSNAAVVTVSPSTPGAWHSGPQITCNLAGLTTSSYSFVATTAPPLGRGALQLDIGTNGNSLLVVVNESFNGVPIGNLTQLSYSTFVVNAASHATGQQAPGLLLSIDVNGNGTVFDQLAYEPRLNGVVQLGVWQQWDALAGVWYSIFSLGPSSTLAAYLVAHPSARIASLAGLAIEAGCRNGDWTLFTGRVDALTVGVSGVVTTFDFEPDPPLPEAPALDLFGALILVALLVAIAIRRL